MSDELISGAELTEWQRLADAATPGPWYSDAAAVPWTPRQRSHFADNGASIGISPETSEIVAGGLQDEQGGAAGVLLNADAAFIAMARTALPRLLAERDTAHAAGFAAGAAVQRELDAGVCDARAERYGKLGSVNELSWQLEAEACADAIRSAPLAEPKDMISNGRG